MQDALTTFFSQFEPVPWLCYLFPVLALGILIRCAVSLLTFRPEPEVWAWLTTPDGAHIPVTHWESLIGRGAGCDVQLGYPTVSRTHAVLTRYDDGSWTISDAHSKSGVFVNGKQTALSALRFGDVITMGGVNFTLIPLTKEQERIQAGTRTRAGHAVHQVPTLLLLTLFQLLTAIQLILGGCDPALELTAFGGLIGLEWALYLALRAFRRTGFEAETLAFFLCTMGRRVKLRAGKSDQGAACYRRGRVRVPRRLLVAARSGAGKENPLSGGGRRHFAAGGKSGAGRGKIRREKLDAAWWHFVPAVGAGQGGVYLDRGGVTGRII